MTDAMPSPNVPAVDLKTGLFSTTWISFFAQLTGRSSALQPITPDASPYSFTAQAAGSLAVTGGTVSSIRLTRGRTTINVPEGNIPMAQGDVAVVAYSAAPSIAFIPA